MNDTVKILGIAGSLRSDSYNRAALVAAQGLLEDGVTLELFDLEGLPLFNQDKEGQPEPRVVEFKKRIRDADAILFSTPEYNYSMPGVLKNAIDWASRPPAQPFDGKPIAIMGASVGAMGSVRAQYHLRQCFVFLNGAVMSRPEVMIPAVGQKFDAEGVLTDEATRGFIAAHLAAFKAWILRLRMP